MPISVSSLRIAPFNVSTLHCSHCGPPPDSPLPLEATPLPLPAVLLSPKLVLENGLSSCKEEEEEKEEGGELLKDRQLPLMDTSLVDVIAATFQPPSAELSEPLLVGGSQEEEEKTEVAPKSPAEETRYALCIIQGPKNALLVLCLLCLCVVLQQYTPPTACYMF